MITVSKGAPEKCLHLGAGNVDVGDAVTPCSIASCATALLTFNTQNDFD